MIKVDSDKALKAVNQLASNLKPRAVASAISRSINRTITHERTVSRKIVRQKYNMPSDVVDNFAVRTANPGSLTGKLEASSRAIPLHKFNPSFKSENYSAKIVRTKNGKEVVTQKQVQLRTGRAPKVTGVIVTILKGKRRTIPWAFITRGELKPVFARGIYAGKGFQFGKSRLPISPVRTTSLYQAIAGQASREELNQDALQFYAKTFEREINFQIQKATKQIS